MELIVWPVKSTTRAQDGLYVYDTVQRLYDSQFGEGDPRDVARYIRLGPMGEAFSRPERTVLVIDEVDKADLEFPNDLLWELDRMSFLIPETGATVTARQRPVVIVTSNAEKELPDAFLRRCVFHYIAFPRPEQMREIVGVHHPDLPERLLAAAMDAFYLVREVEGLRKRPSTSELVDWVQALALGGVEPDRILEELPFLGVVLKTPGDVEAVRRAAARGRRPSRYGTD
jgi:MoxR-like ATPase